MTPELFWMTLTLFMTVVMSIPYILNRQMVRGLLGAIANHEPETGADQALWARRAMAAHRNAVENLVIFAPSVLALLFLHVSTPATRIAAIVYFFARAAHYVIYLAGVPVARTVAFLVGMAAQITILLTILGLF